MHEVSLCRALVELLRQQAEQDGFSRVHAVWLQVGPLAAVVPEAMALAFEACTPGTLAEGARLHLVEEEARARCRCCGGCWRISSRLEPCPDCGAYELDVLSGDALTISELEVE